MNKTLKYSIMYYKTDEKINVPIGILFSDETGYHKYFREAENLERLIKENDTVSVSSIKILTNSIKEEVESLEKIDINDYIKYYISDFFFSKVRTHETNKFRKLINKICKLYF